MDAAEIGERVRQLSDELARERSSRQLRRELVASDFERLREAGFLLTGVPVELGGIWQDASRAARPVAEILRTLAHGDASIALVCAMHPSVLGFWLATPRVPPPDERGWNEQRQHAAETARQGAWWGTITSEAGSGVMSPRPRRLPIRDRMGPATSYRG
jgi:alkylation response protein AidB-like acyl-CoA dehydrogenase